MHNVNRRTKPDGCVATRARFVVNEQPSESEKNMTAYIWLVPLYVRDASSYALFRPLFAGCHHMGMAWHLISRFSSNP
jgi:hypothetical protein